MNYILKVKDAEIPLSIQNYKKSKSIKLYFREGVLKVTKSPYISKKQVDRLIKNNEEKIYEEYKKILEKNNLSNEKWRTGDIILYKGKEYKINKKYDENNEMLDVLEVTDTDEFSDKLDVIYSYVTSIKEEVAKLFEIANSYSKSFDI